MSRTGDRAGTKSAMHKNCQGRTKGIRPRVWRKFYGVKLEPVLSAGQLDAIKAQAQLDMDNYDAVHAGEAAQ